MDDTMPLAAGQIVQQGAGYQLVEADPSLSEDTAVDDETDQPVTMPAGKRRIWVFENWSGVQAAPIPDSLKADMAEEMGQATYQAEEDDGVWMMDEQAALDAIAADAEVTPGGGGGGGGEARPVQYGLCGKKKKSSSKSKTLSLAPRSFEQVLGPNSKLSGNLNQQGQISITVFYTKKSRCGITYAVKVDRVETSGAVALNGSELAFSDTVESTLLDRSFTLFDISTDYSFWVGPVRIVITPNLLAQANVKLTSALTVQGGIRAPLNGRYAFSYRCTRSSCQELAPMESSFDTNPDPSQLLGSVSSQVMLRPSINVAARVSGALYIRQIRFIRAEVGVNLAIPAQLWAYAGNTCGDADGDGVNESVQSAILDINAEIYVYTALNTFGHVTVAGRDLSLGGKWKKKSLFAPDGLGDRQRYTYVRNFLFRDLMSSGSSALSPMLVAASNLPQTGANVILQARPCVPFFASPLQYVVDFGDQPPQTAVGPTTGVKVTHDFASAGSRQVNAYIASDLLERDIHSPVTGRVFQVEPPTPVNCAFNGQSVAHGASLTAYASPSVPFGQGCASQVRVCTNGQLSGSYVYASCSPVPPAACTFNSSTIAHGGSVRAYAMAQPLAGEPCESQQRVCSNGVLSGSYRAATCTPRTLGGGGKPR